MNTKKRILLFSLYFGYCYLGCAQIPKNSNIIFGYEEVKELSFYKYEPKFLAKAIITSQKNADNEYPEQLMESIISATNQDWVNYNTLEGEQDEQEQSHFDRIKSMDRDKNYFELHHKLSFNVGDVPTVIVKFFFYQENENPLSASYVMQKVNERWQRTSHPSLSTLSIIVMRMKTEVLQGIILGNSKDMEIKKLRNRVTSNGGIDLTELEVEFNSWYSPEVNQKKIDLFKDPRTW